MASKTATTWARREIRRNNAGRARKAALERNGTTPKFPIHTPEIDAAAPADQVSPAVREALGR